MKAVCDATFPEIEERILAYWKEHDTFQKSVDQHGTETAYVFYDGPPFATGLPHYGHLLAGTIKDIIPRYWTMRGKRVERVFGWDCHGLPVEFEVEKSLNLKGRSDIEAYGVAKFNEKCREIVLRYTEEWKLVVARMGRWVDFENGYKTMDANYMESIWWVVKQLWDKGLIYEGKKIVRYSPRISAVLSNFEANLNYKMTQDPAVTVKFKIESETDTYFLGWTTTPWTLISNLALSVGPDIRYVKVKDDETGDCYYLSESRIGAYYKKNKGFQIVSTCIGRDLEGKTYEPLFDYFAAEKKNGAFRVLLADFVTTDDGTGIVHTAPAYGEDDYTICNAYKIDPVDPIDAEGKFTDVITEYAGLFFKDADKPIIKALKNDGKLIKHTTIEHSYPFCYRSEEPLIFKLIPTWYVRVEAIKEDLLKSNDEINWVPEHIKAGRFGKWIANARDWAISRNRFWGCPLPIWRCPECQTVDCLGDVASLEERVDQKVPDIHKHFIDDLHFPCREKGCDGTMVRVPEVLDCWFESGSMPYAQHHYPFENKAHVEAHFPADFIAEGQDQTRGWFYTLNVLSSALFKRPAFRNVIVNGMILAGDGKKMSKRLKNYPAPDEILNRFGADALRLYLINSPVLKADDLKFTEEGVRDTVRAVILPFWNAYSFFVTYARLDDWQAKAAPSTSENPLDRWIISKLQSLIKSVNSEMECYHLYAVVPQLVDFLDQLTNWYIRRSRRRFWTSDNPSDKDHAYHTLYEVMTTYIRLIAPLMPFIAEEIYQNLVADSVADAPESVHLTRFPQHDETRIDEARECKMAFVQDVVMIGRNLRVAHNLKVRQPLAELTVITANSDDQQVVTEMASVISDELNVKRIHFNTNEAAFVDFTAKPNMKILGKKLGKRARELGQWVATLSSLQISEILTGKSIEWQGIILGKDELLVYRAPKPGAVIENQGAVTVVINTALTPELIAEGRAREVISRIQRARKAAEFNVEDRIVVGMNTDENIVKAVKQYLQYVQEETLAEEVHFMAIEGASYTVDEKINEFSCTFSLRRVAT